MILERIRVGSHPYVRVTRRNEERTAPTLIERAVEFEEHSRERSGKHEQTPQQKNEEHAPAQPEGKLPESAVPHPHLDVRV